MILYCSVGIVYKRFRALFVGLLKLFDDLSIFFKLLLFIIAAGQTSNVLMKVSLDFVEQNECNRSYSSSTNSNLKFGINPSNQICAGQMEGGKDTCQV